jgi:D-arabinose 5-phosphate isomerase GutQ
VRFSQALGFEGFPELQRAAREEYRRAHAGVGESPLFSVERSDFETAIAADHANVEETARKATPANVERAIAAISSASRIVIAGTDQMAFFASYLRHLLMLLDLRAELVASPSQEALGRLARIDSETLVIALSAGRPHALVVRAMKLAHHRQATTIAITDATMSEVAKLAQIKLYYSSNSPDLRALAHRAFEHDPGARLRRLLARRRAVRRPDQGVSVEVGAAVLAPALPGLRAGAPSGGVGAGCGCVGAACETVACPGEGRVDQLTLLVPVWVGRGPARCRQAAGRRASRRSARHVLVISTACSVALSARSPISRMWALHSDVD